MSDQSLEIQRLREELARLSGEVETLRAERAEMKSANEKLLAEKEEMQQVINDLRSMMAWFRKKLFYKMSEKNLPLDPNVLEPTLRIQLLYTVLQLLYICRIVVSCGFQNRNFILQLFFLG